MAFSDRLLGLIGRSPKGKWIPKINEIVNDELDIYKRALSREDVSSIPDTSTIPLDNPTKWLKIDDVICCFVDMMGSTRMSVSAHPNSTARLYRLFTSTAVRIFDELDSPYIDIKGDGVFALYDKTKPHLALAATVAFKTFVEDHFIPAAKEKDLALDGHYAIDRKSVLVRRLGFRRVAGRTDRQNEVWAGKPINMASKLAGLTSGGELLVSDRFYEALTDEGAINSCGCPNGVPAPLWKEIDLTDNDLFDFDKAYQLGSTWCKDHGTAFFSHLVTVDA